MNWATRFAKLNPAPVLAVLAAVLSAVTAWGIDVTPDQAAAITGMVTALLAVGQALAVKPFYWPVLSGVVQGAGILLASYGFDTSNRVAAVAAVLQLVLGLAVRPAVTPETKRLPLARE